MQRKPDILPYVPLPTPVPYVLTHLHEHTHIHTFTRTHKHAHTQTNTHAHILTLRTHARTRTLTHTSSCDGDRHVLTVDQATCTLYEAWSCREPNGVDTKVRLASARMHTAKTLHLAAGRANAAGQGCCTACHVRLSIVLGPMLPRYHHL